MQHYDFEASAKTLAWANLVGVCASVYGFKIMSVINTAKHQNDDNAL
jgi:hypothetical protein